MIGEKTLGLRIANRIDEYAVVWEKHTATLPQGLAPDQVRIVAVVLRTIALAIRDVTQ